ncbi:MAG: hypothetical protein U1E74_05800 [Paenacidovorax caeni]
MDCPEADRCRAEVEVGVLVVARGFGSKPIPSNGGKLDTGRRAVVVYQR